MTNVVHDRFIGKGSVGAAKKANVATAASFAKTKKDSAFFEKITRIVALAWPRKTTAHVAHLTGTSERSVQFWLAGETRTQVEHVVGLLRTDEGYAILEAIMADCKVQWWVETQMAHGVRVLRRSINDQQRRIDELKALQNQIDLFQQ